MPTKTSKKQAAAALPSIPKELIDQFVSGPMSAEAVNAASMAFKKALIERALGAELSHRHDIGVRSCNHACKLPLCANARPRIYDPGFIQVLPRLIMRDVRAAQSYGHRVGIQFFDAMNNCLEAVMPRVGSFHF